MLSRGTSGKPVRARCAPGEGKGGEFSTLAGRMCRRKDFQRWVVLRSGPAPEGISPDQHAAAFVRRQCGITSRARLDHDAQALTHFHENVRKPFVAWLGASQ